MKNTIGNTVTVTLFGESHGNMIGAVMDGLAPGVVIDEDLIRERLARRRPKGRISTARCEADEFSIVSGVFRGKSTGTPICILIPNTNTKSSDYDELSFVPRPSHADYTAFCKYHGFQDTRGGGHFSGRLTAPIVALGAIAESALSKRGISVATHILSVGDITDRPFNVLEDDIAVLKAKENPVLSDGAWEKMQEYIKNAAQDGDSVGGILECVAAGVPAGVGEPYFDSVESILAHAVYSIPAVKGVEFGDGFALAKMRGSEANDPLRVKGGKVTTSSNHSGGIYGGITSGDPILLRAAIKPTPSIYKTQDSVNLSTMENTSLTVKGRHDPAIVHRASPVLDAVVALALLDMISGRFGVDYFSSAEN